MALCIIHLDIPHGMLQSIMERPDVRSLSRREVPATRPRCAGGNGHGILGVVLMGASASGGQMRVIGGRNCSY